MLDSELDSEDVDQKIIESVIEVEILLLQQNLGVNISFFPTRAKRVTRRSSVITCYIEASSIQVKDK